MNEFELSQQIHVHDDGLLVELISMNYTDIPFNCFHSYQVMIKSGCFRVMHYHKTKEELLAYTNGNITILLEDFRIKKSKEISFDENVDNYSLIYIPPMAHAIKNVGIGNASVVVFSKNTEIKGDTIAYKMEI
jgi:oxalate decarboxylase/phosphoglucose isomerase-like protein (cupin superfamily)